MTKFTNLKDKIISKVHGVKYFDILKSDEQNIKQAQTFVNEIIRLNDEAVERYNELQRYCETESYSTVTAYFYANKIYNVLDRKNLTFDNATLYLDSLMNKEFYNIEDAIEKLKPLAIEKLKEQGKSVREEDIVLDDLFNKHLFFKESQADYFAKLKNDYILNNKEPESYFDKLFYKYYNGYILQDIYDGFYGVLETVFHYVEYNEQNIDYLDSYKDFPLTTKRLAWMENVDTGSAYAVPKKLVDDIFNSVSKARQDVVLNGIKINKCLQECATTSQKEEFARQEDLNEAELNNIKIFEYQAGYLKDRCSITSRERTLDDDKKVVMSGTDLTTLIEFSLDIKQVKESAITLINYMVNEKGTIPSLFVLSDYIREYINLDEVAVYNTDNQRLTKDEVYMLANNDSENQMEE